MYTGKRVTNITFCLLFTNKGSATSVSNTLLSIGCIPYIAFDIEKAKEILLEKNINFLLIDLDFAENISFNFLKELKNNESYSNLLILATSFNTKEEFKKKLTDYNIILFIPKPIDNIFLREAILNTLDKLKNKFVRRKHIRIVPENDEMMRLSFKLKSNKYISARVINVSMGGIAAMLFSQYESNELNRGKLIEHLIFQADNREIDVDAKIVNKKDKFIAFEFTHFYSDSYSNLLKYVTRKISLL